MSTSLRLAFRLTESPRHRHHRDSKRMRSCPSMFDEDFSFDVAWRHTSVAFPGRSFRRHPLKCTLIGKMTRTNVSPIQTCSYRLAARPCSHRAVLLCILLETDDLCRDFTLIVINGSACHYQRYTNLIYKSVAQQDLSSIDRTLMRY